MADTIHLPDGSMEVIFQPKDFHYLIEKHMGYDAAGYFEKMVDELQEEADYTAAKVDTDLESYEASLESNTACFNDLLDNIEELKKLLQQQRIDRRKIYKVLDRMETQITNQI